MNNCLILLTNYYPFYKGEEYLESELPILAKKFEKIYILSTMIGENESQTREVPQNVKVIPSGVNHGKVNRIKMLLKSINMGNLEEKKINISQKMYSKYFRARSEMIVNNYIKKIDDIDWNEFNSITIYSYWLYITAKVGIELKQKYFKNQEVPIISRAHRYDLYEDDTLLKFLPERENLLKNLDKIHPVSDHGTNELKTKYPEFSEKIYTKRLGTKSPGFLSDSDYETFHILSCSAVRPVKRLELIIDALAILQENGLDIRWTHLGDGIDFDKIKAKANNLLANGSYSLPGFVQNKDVIEFYKQNSVSYFINVSESEGIPVSIMEAMSVGVPVIATNVGGTKEIVRDNYNGKLIKKEITKEELAKHIENLYFEGDIKQKKLSENSFSTWSKSYNAFKNYEEFTKELLEYKDRR